MSLPGDLGVALLFSLGAFQDNRLERRPEEGGGGAGVLTILNTHVFSFSAFDTACLDTASPSTNLRLLKFLVFIRG